MRVSQIYTLPFWFSFATIVGEVGDNLDIEEKIIIHEHIEKMGLATELVTAKDENTFYNYLEEKGLDLPPDSKLILNKYIGEEYTFVVSWIFDVEEFKKESATEDVYDRYGIYDSTSSLSTVGVSIKFPTEKIFFPLKPTSIYGSQKVPILIYVMDHIYRCDFEEHIF